METTLQHEEIVGTSEAIQKTLLASERVATTDSAYEQPQEDRRTTWLRP